MSEQNENSGIDFTYKRPFTDEQGNLIDPRTSWDNLLKYYRKYRKLLGVGKRSRIMSASTPAQAWQMIHAELKHKSNKEKATSKQSEDLKRKEDQRKKAKTKKSRERRSLRSRKDT